MILCRPEGTPSPVARLRSPSGGELTTDHLERAESAGAASILEVHSSRYMFAQHRKGSQLGTSAWSPCLSTAQRARQHLPAPCPGVRAVHWLRLPAGGAQELCSRLRCGTTAGLLGAAAEPDAAFKCKATRPTCAHECQHVNKRRRTRRS